MSNMFKNLFLWLIIAVILITVFSNFGPRVPASEQLTYSAFLDSVDKGKIASVVISDRTIAAVTKDGNQVSTYIPMEDQFLLG